VVALENQQRGLERDYDDAVLFAAARGDSGDAHVRAQLRLPHLEDLGRWRTPTSGMTTVGPTEVSAANR